MPISGHYGVTSSKSVVSKQPRIALVMELSSHRSPVVPERAAFPYEGAILRIVLFVAQEVRTELPTLTEALLW